MNYRIQIYVRVIDTAKLHTAAMQCARDDGMRRADAYSTLGTKKHPNTAACLHMMLDPGSLPGATIFETEVE